MEIGDVVRGASWKNLFDLLYAVGQARYATFDQLKDIQKQDPPHPLKIPALKIATKEKLQFLASEKYLRERDGVFSLRKRGRDLLSKNKFQTAFIDYDLKAKDYSDHLRQVSDTLFFIMAEPDFCQVFYWTFYNPQESRRPEDRFLIPDACVLYRRGDKAKLTFLEVEATDKPPDYLKAKMANYEVIASQPETHDYMWRSVAGKLGLQFCLISDFCFGVRVV